MRTLSVISRISRWGSIPLSDSAVPTSSARWGEISWRRERLTDRLSSSPASPAPCRQLFARLDQHPPSERDDESGLLGDGDEAEGSDHTEAGMAPSDQCLESRESVVGEGDDRLVLQEELGPAERPAEPVGQIEPLEHSRTHGRLEDLDPVLPLLLRLVHGRVRLAQELLGRLARLGEGHADADRQPHLVAFEVGGVAEDADDAVGEVDDGLRPLHVDHQHRELVTAEPGDGVAGSHDRREEPAGSAPGRCHRRGDRGCR